LARVPPLIDEAEALLIADGSAEPDPAVTALIAHLRGFLAYYEGAGARSLRYLEEAVGSLAHLGGVAQQRAVDLHLQHHPVQNAVVAKVGLEARHQVDLAVAAASSVMESDTQAIGPLKWRLKYVRK
jgi:hypothetical protein